MYAFKDGTTTLLVADTNNQEFKERVTAILKEHAVHAVETEVLDHFTDPVLMGFEPPVFKIQHASDSAQDEFITQSKVIILPRARALDRHNDMLTAELPDFFDINDTRTIAQICGVENEDRHDRRTPEQKAQDLEIKKMMEKMRENGEMSDDSFTSAGDNNMQVTNVHTSQQADGSTIVDRIMGRKASAANEVFENNAVLTVDVNGTTLTVPVYWNNTTLHGSIDTVDTVWVDQKYGDPADAVASVTQDGTGLTSKVIYNPIIQNIHAEIKLENNKTE